MPKSGSTRLPRASSRNTILRCGQFFLRYTKFRQQRANIQKSQFLTMATSKKKKTPPDDHSIQSYSSENNLPPPDPDVGKFRSYDLPCTNSSRTYGRRTKWAKDMQWKCRMDTPYGRELRESILILAGMLSTCFNVVRLLIDESPLLRSALRYAIYGKSRVFDAERFIDVMQAFENFITAAKSGGGEDLNGDMAELGILQIQRSNVPVFPFPFSSSSQSEQPIQTRAALAFLLSEKGNFFREFLLDEVLGVERNASQCEIQKAFHKYYYLGISLRPSLV